MESNQITPLFGLGIDPNSKSHLFEAARWARFLAIVGFVICGLILIIGIFFGSFLGMMGNRFGQNDEMQIDTTGLSAMVTVIYVIIAILYFFPCLFLFRFANQMKKALASDDQNTLNSSFQNLKVLFRYVGILTIIALAFYTIIFLIAIAGAAGSGF